jgi:hypothetical protein
MRLQRRDTAAARFRIGAATLLHRFRHMMEKTVIFSETYETDIKPTYACTYLRERKNADRSHSGNITMKPRRGTSRAYTLAKVKAYKLSARAGRRWRPRPEVPKFMCVMHTGCRRLQKIFWSIMAPFCHFRERIFLGNSVT